MKKQRTARSEAFSMLELVLVLGIVFLLCALLVPTFSDAKRRANSVQCLNNLKQLGLASRNFGHDHNNLFPMQVSTNAGGSLEYYLEGKNRRADFYFAFRHFQPLARELPSPKVLICPADNRSEGGSFEALCNSNISYFIGTTANWSRPESILMGDRNLVQIDSESRSCVVLSGKNAEWNGELHNRSGNLLFADGHCKTFDNSGVQKLLGGISGTTILPPIAPQNDFDSSWDRTPARWQRCSLGVAHHH